MQFIKAADGTMCEEIVGPDGESEYVPAIQRPGVEFVEVGKTGRYFARPVGDVVREDSEGKHVNLRAPGSEESVRVPVQDEAEYYRQRDEQSHKEFFEREGKQKLKRQKAIERQLEQMVQDISPGAIPGVRSQVIKDEQYFELTAAFNQAMRDGNAHLCEFRPLSTYREKVARARPILNGEVGLFVPGGEKGLRDGSPVTIVRLEQGYGTGTLIQVTDEVKHVTKEPEQRVSVEPGGTEGSSDTVPCGPLEGSED